MIKLTIIRSLLIFMFVLFQQVHAETIHLVAEIFPPQTNRDGTGQQFDIARAIYEPLGYSVSINVYPYRRVIHLLENKLADIAVGVAKVRNAELLFSEHPHDSDNLVAIYPEKNKIPWQGVKSLLGQRVLFIAGLSEGFSSDLNLSGYDISEVNTRVQALKRLLLNRDDFLVDCECALFLEDVIPYRPQFIIKRIGLTKIYAAFSNNEKGLKLKKIWQREFPEFIKTEAARDIYKKWGLMREYGIIQKVMQSRELSIQDS